MAEKNGRLQLENNDWKPDTGGYGGNRNLNVSVAEEAREEDEIQYVARSIQGWWYQ